MVRHKKHETGPLVVSVIDNRAKYDRYCLATQIVLDIFTPVKIIEAWLRKNNSPINSS